MVISCVQESVQLLTIQRRVKVEVFCVNSTCEVTLFPSCHNMLRHIDREIQDVYSVHTHSWCLAPHFFYLKVNSIDQAVVPACMYWSLYFRSQMPLCIFPKCIFIRSLLDAIASPSSYPCQSVSDC